MIENLLKQHKDNIALSDAKGTVLTYGILEQKSAELFKVIGKRTLVFSFCRNEVGSVLGYITFLRYHIVPVLLNAEIETELRQQLIEIYEPAFLYLPEEMTEAFSNYERVWESYGYCLLRTSYAMEKTMYQELGLLLTTSGSTGSPKLVRQSYKNILSNAESIAEYLELTADEKPISTLPMNYTYGLSIINSHLLVGAEILLTDEPMTSRFFWEFFRQNKATSFGGVPFTYEMLKKLRFFQMELPSLRYMTQAGGKLSPELHREFANYAKNTEKKFIVMYGQTEATARMAYLPSERSLEKYGSMGIAIPHGRLWLKDVDGNQIKEPDIVGELVYEGENVTLGYAECLADLAKEDERHGVLQTGDMAKMDADGYFYIVGRKRRFLKVYGNRVNLDEVERMIKHEFEQIECACAGVDDHLYVFVTTNQENIHKQIRKFLAGKTGLNAKAYAVKYVMEIPKNDAGKTLYRKLEKYYD